MNNHSSRFVFQRLFTVYGLYAALSLLGPIDARGATYYVATTGNDSNPGTVSQPLKSFPKAISLLQPGDTLYIRGGTYTERMDFQAPVRKTGEANAWIRIAGYPGETVTVRYADTYEHAYGPIRMRGASAYFIFENLVLDGVNGTRDSVWNIRDGNHHIVIRNVEFMNFKASALRIMGSDIQIVNCKIHHSAPVPPVTGGYYGIYYATGNNVLIEGNEIYDNNGGGIHAFPGPISNAIIRNNIVHHNNSSLNSVGFVPGILVYADIDYTQYGPGVIDGVQIYNNLVYSNCANNPFRTCGGIQVANGARNVKVWNNTVYGNKGYGISIHAGSNGPPVNTAVQNNIVYSNTATQIIDRGIDSTITHNLTTDPNFVKGEAFDFRLQTHSPAIDAGLDLDMVRVDIMNFSRPRGAYDIGAYEGGASDSKSPFPPKNLSLN